MIGLLSVTGMRVGEALRLDRSDLDNDRSLLTVRHSKFDRSRQVPLHASTVNTLRTYAHLRDQRFPAARSEFTGVAVHDAWAPYDTYEQATHALCGAHVLRELVAVTETSATGGQWAAGLIAILRELKQTTDTARDRGETGLDPVWLAERVRLYTAAAQVGFNVSSARRNQVEAKHNALARRLLDRRDDILRFAYDLRVPFDNNGSEQSIRMTKLRQKISGTMRRPQGAHDFVTIRSYLQTAAKQGQNALDVLTALFEGRPWLPSTS